MKLKTLSFLLLLTSTSAFADPATNSDPTQLAQPDQTLTSSEDPITMSNIPTFMTLSYENVKRSDGYEDIGMFGVNMDFQIYKPIYGGVGLYGAGSGDLGGLFVFGANLGLRKNIYSDWWVNADYFAGGGGAHHDGDQNANNSGLMTRANVGLAYNLSGILIGGDYSYIHFSDYQVSSQQFGLNITMPGDMLTGSPSYLGKKTSDLSNVWLHNIVSFYRTFISAYQETYFLNNSKDSSGNDLDENMQLIGAKAGIFLSPKMYLSVSSAGSYNSNQNGYMDFFLGLGYRDTFYHKWFYYLNADVGAGGGGSTDTGGGFMYKPGAGIGYQVTKNFIASVGGGYMKAPSGNFEGPFANLSLSYQFLSGEATDFGPPDPGNGNYYFSGWRFSALTETYNNPQRSNDKEVENIDLVVFNFEKLISPNFFVGGQGASAYGGNAGAYATGMLGVGAQTDTYHHFRLSADVMAGAAGGGGIAVGDGAVWQPEVGLSYDVTPYVSLLVKGGRIMALDDDLDSTTVSAGIQFNFTSLQEEF
jgi:hypothetical protein